MAAIGEGESTLLSLVDAKGDPAGITGLAYREATGKLIRTGKAKAVVTRRFSIKSALHRRGPA